MAATTVEIPGYVAGTWTIDPAHTDISFTVRHMMVSKVRGHFQTFHGEIITAADPLSSSATVTIDLASLDTNNAQRDEHIRSADFFEVETYPTMTYRTTGVRAERGDFVVDGELTLHGVTRPVALEVEANGFSQHHPMLGTRTGFSAKGEINRKDFGIDIDLPMDGGGVVVADKVSIVLEVEAVLNTPEA